MKYNRFLKKFFVFLTLAIILFQAVPVFAQTILQDKVDFYKAKVVDITKEEMKNAPGSDVPTDFQTLKIEFLDGPKAGTTIELTDNYIKQSKGDLIYIRDTIRADSGIETYWVEDAYRMNTIYLFTFIFIVLTLLIGGFQGLRGLISLAGSFLLILYVLLPGILHGYSPILVSILVSSFIIILGSYVTHGFNKTTSSAVAGMIITVIVTGILAYIAIHMGKLTGYSGEDVTYLSLNSRGTIDIVGLLLGGIMIGLLGVLYDVSIGQAISVEELHTIAPHLSRKVIYLRALRIGREHIGALVNTLAIAYVGVALPLLLLFSQTHTPGMIIFTMNREIFSEEIIRALVGSIGLVLAVPITTLLAVSILIKKPKGEITSDKLEKEKVALDHFEHHH